MSHATLERPATPKIRLTRLFINNDWVEPAERGTFETYNPATGDIIASVAQGTAADVDRAVKAARKAISNEPWRWPAIWPLAQNSNPDRSWALR